MNLIRIRCFLFSFMLISPLLTFAQVDVDVDKAVVEDKEWSEGTVTLNDGRVLSGQLKLNTKTGLLAFESGATSKSFTPRNIQSFSFFDNIQEKQRSFISVNYSGPDPKKNILGGPKGDQTVSEKGIPQFFEILVELKNFALLSSMGQIQVDAQQNGNPEYNNSLVIGRGSYVEYSQTETLFIFDAEGNITPILDITEREVDGKIFDSKKTKRKKLDRDIIEEKTASHYQKLNDYAKENKLSFKKRKDLILILEHYKKLESN